jgi:hypothetical protein
MNRGNEEDIRIVLSANTFIMRRMSAPIFSKRIILIATAFALSILVLFVTTSTSTKKEHDTAAFF